MFPSISKNRSTMDMKWSSGTVLLDSCNLRQTILPILPNQMIYLFLTPHIRLTCSCVNNTTYHVQTT